MCQIPIHFQDFQEMIYFVHVFPVSRFYYVLTSVITWLMIADIIAISMEPGMDLLKKNVLKSEYLSLLFVCCLLFVCDPRL